MALAGLSGLTALGVYASWTGEGRLPTLDSDPLRLARRDLDRQNYPSAAAQYEMYLAIQRPAALAHIYEYIVALGGLGRWTAIIETLEPVVRERLQHPGFVHYNLGVAYFQRSRGSSSAEAGRRDRAAARAHSQRAVEERLKGADLLLKAVDETIKAEGEGT
jgi:hypothetical protein